MNVRQLKVIQAFLICEGFDDEGRLVADGVWGEHSQNALSRYFVRRGIKVAESQDGTEAIWQSFQEDDFEFDLERGAADTIKLVQALLITQGFDDEGRLVADGVNGESTHAASLAYVVANELTKNPFELVRVSVLTKSQEGYFAIKLPE